jgi:hypothetical protein
MADNTEPKRYEIEKLTDILQIPEDKFDAFVEDLRTYHTMGIHMTKLLETVAEIGGIKAEVIPQKMTWIDDDKHDATVYLKPVATPDTEEK